MRIKISEIPKAGRTVSFEINPFADEEFIESGYTGKGSGLKFIAKVSIEHETSKVMIDGSLTGSIEVLCSRCGAVVDKNISLDIHKIFLKEFDTEEESGKAAAQYKLSEEELDIDFYSGDSIDLTELVREDLILDYPMVFLCKEDCLGACPVCGVNKNNIDCNCKV